jgi:hypothetical protein
VDHEALKERIKDENEENGKKMGMKKMGRRWE